jgi:hypothetical protein
MRIWDVSLHDEPSERIEGFERPGWQRSISHADTLGKRGRAGFGDARKPSSAACPSSRPPSEARLACLGNEAIGARFHAWRGLSGRRYVVSVFPIDHAAPAAGLPDLGPAVLIAVARQDDRRVKTSARSLERPRDWRGAAEALHADADEWHVHLLAESPAARMAVLADILAAPASPETS